MHPETAGQLESLLNRYRDGGYSRELPPILEKPKTPQAELPPIKGKKLLDLPLSELPPAPWATAGAE